MQYEYHMTLGWIWLYEFVSFDIVNLFYVISTNGSFTGKNGVAVHNGSNGHPTYSKKLLFWKCWCYGIAIALGGKFWDTNVGELKVLFQTPIADPAMSVSSYLILYMQTY